MDELITAMYTTYNDRLHNYLARLSNKAPSNPDVRDMAGDAWLKITAHIHKYNTDKPPWPWIRTIATNTYFNQLRKRSRRPQGHSSEYKEGQHKKNSNPARRLELLEGITFIRDYLNEDNWKIWQKYVMGYTPTEIAKQQDLSRKAVYERLRRTRTTITNLLEVFEDEF